MLRKAKLEDVKNIHKIISFFARQNLMLSRSVGEVSENIRDFVIAEEENKIIACCALQIYIDDLAEIKSLAVSKKYQNKGIGKKLIKHTLIEAEDLNVKKIFALTYVPELFEKLNFKKLDKEKLPHKIWRECVKCHKFPDCDEIAMIIKLKGQNGDKKKNGANPG